MHAKSEPARSEPAPGTLDLGELLQGVAAKDRSAFEAFYDATVDRALGLAVRITQQQELAEEVVSDVYMQVWRQAERFDQTRGNAMAWLSVICRSRALDSVRKMKSARATEASVSEITDLESEDHPQNLLAATERHSAVNAGLAQLQPDERQLLALAYFRGHSHSELAEITGLPLGTVKTKTRRSLAKLKDFVIAWDDCPEGSP